jgi:hypothetical protein
MKPKVFTCLFALLLCPAAFGATWSFVQAQRLGSCTSGTSSCSLTISGVAGGVGDVIVVHSGGFNTSVITISSATLSGNSFTLIAAGACAAATGTQNIDCAYLINPTAGGTAITVNLTSAPASTWQITAEEYRTTGTASLDGTPGTSMEPTNTTSQVGPTLTLSGTNDLIVQACRCANAPSAVSGGFTNDFGSFTNATSVAYLLNTTTGAGPTWTTASGKSVMNGLAFSDGGASAVKNPPRASTF